MPNFHPLSDWRLADRKVTAEPFFLGRRKFLKTLGILGVGAAAGMASGCGPARDAAQIGAQENPPGAGLYPARRNSLFSAGGPVTDEAYVASYNNFYEFSAFKSRAYKNAARLRTFPWQVEVNGLVEKPRIFAIDELVRAMPLEERLYRFRCVEAWTMTVPWTGFSMRALIKAAQPLSSARYVRFVSFLSPAVAPNQNSSYGQWPYTEGLTIEEAGNELAFLATGMFGHPLPKQNGAPLRLVVPWKYGFKSAKSIVKIEFTSKRPRTFWNSNRPHELWLHRQCRPGGTTSALVTSRGTAHRHRRVPADTTVQWLWEVGRGALWLSA